MPYETDNRLKHYLDTHQLHREQLCTAILAADKRFSDVRPRQPRGGPDGGRDVEAVFRGDQTAYGAVGFVNGADDSKTQKRRICTKFSKDLKSALNAAKRPEVFVFFTNINLTAGDKVSLVSEAKSFGLTHCEIFDRERLRIALDAPDGFYLRLQYLGITLSDAEQASFFARWGDEIQSIISRGFQRTESALNRAIFFHEAADPLRYLTLHFELDRTYSAERIGHFRLFCSMFLKEPHHNIFGIMFGSSDKSNRMRYEEAPPSTGQLPGIKHGISSGKWEMYLADAAERDAVDGGENRSDDQNKENARYKKVGCSWSIGTDEVEFLSISYDKLDLFRFVPSISLRALNEAMFLPILNNSLAEKVRAIRIYANGYDIKEICAGEFKVDTTKFTPDIPVPFSSEELEDPWVRIRPSDKSCFNIEFFTQTPKRMFAFLSR